MLQRWLLWATLQLLHVPLLSICQQAASFLPMDWPPCPRARQGPARCLKRLTLKDGGSVLNARQRPLLLQKETAREIMRCPPILPAVSKALASALGNVETPSVETPSQYKQQALRSTAASHIASGKLHTTAAAALKLDRDGQAKDI